MKFMKKLAMSATLALASASAFANAGYSDIFVFGDSLSDTGNLQAILQDGVTPDRFTNGPVAIEVIAAGLGLPLSNSNHLLGGALPFGNNYAIAGAKTLDEDGNEATPDINLPTQVNSFLQINGGVAPSDALYVVLIGGNDIREARGIRAAGLLANTRDERKAARVAAREYIKSAVASEEAQISKLIAAGAHNILVVNAPDIGAIPETDLVELQTSASAESNRELKRADRLELITSKLSAKFNRKLSRVVGRLERHTGANIMSYDLSAFLNEQIEAAEDLGYTNTTDACIFIFSQGGAVNPECADFPVASGFLFWDEIHPTTMAHQNAGTDILQSVFLP